MGPCGVLGAPIRGNVEKTVVFETFPRGLAAPWSLLGGFLVSLGAPLEVLGGSQGRPLEVLGGARGVFWDPWGCLGGPYGAIGGLMKTLKNQWFLLCFEHLEVLGRTLGIPLGPWGLL